jgi:RimJ/RimL family protein N-acetyltransferase
MDVLRTERLILRRLTTDDAEFMIELMNDPDWLRYIGDRGVRTVEDARAYLLAGPLAMYDRLGFGLYCVEIRASCVPIGICGLLKRDALDDVDIGFAMLPAFRARGYAYEAAAATLDYAKRELGLTRVVAIVSPENEQSMRLLRKLGLGLERTTRLSEEGKEVCIFAPETIG